MLAHVSPDTRVIRYVDPALDVPVPDGWSVLPVEDVGHDLVAGLGEVLEGPAVTVAGGHVERRWTVVALPASEALARRSAQVKEEAARRILSIAPEWRQRNLTARASELALLYPGVRGVDLPEPERSEYLAGQDIWDRIKAIRVASNGIEATLSAVAAADGATAAAVMAVDITAMWP